MALLEVRDVDKSFPGVHALNKVSLTVEAGEVHALVGQNGAGKSTLVKIVSGAQGPDTGQIIFDGHPVTTFSPTYAASRGIAVVYQRQQLIPWLSVAENILMGELPLRFRTVFDRGRASEVSAALLRRLRVQVDPAVPVAELSPAQRQEIAIAKALYRHAKLIILDEPTAALDASQIDRLFALVDDLRKERVSILYISHHLEEIFRLADRITVLRDSRVVTTRPTTELTQSEVVTLMAGRRLEVVTAEAVGARSPTDEEDEDYPPLLQFETVSSGAALRNVRFSLHPREVLGITGVVGAGGHDVARALFGLDRVTSGNILLNGSAFRASGPSDAIRQGIFLVPEDAALEGLVPYLSVSNNITLVDLPAVTRFGLLQLEAERRVAREYVSSLRIATPTVARPVRNLSGGNQQKVLLAKALQAGADVLVLEEPTQGVDVHAKDEIHKIVRKLALEGKGVLAISTDIRDLLLYADRLLVLRHGRVVANLRVKDTSYADVLDLTVGSQAG